MSEQIFVERGYVGSHQTDTPIETNRFHADLFWIAKEPMRVGRLYDLRLATQEMKCQVGLDRGGDGLIHAGAENGEARPAGAKSSRQADDPNARAARCWTITIAFKVSGASLLLMTGQICGGGTIFGGVYTDRTVAKSKNIFWSEAKITRRERAAQMGHRGAVVWFTGLSGAGKSTIAQALERDLFRRGIHTYVLDGDNVRHGLNSNLGFSPEDRVENIRRVSEVAKLMADSGVVVVTAFISPYRMDRRRAREIALEGNAEFVEVFVDAPLEVCEARDPKHLYKKRARG